VLQINAEDAQECVEYCKGLELLTEDLSPTFLVKFGETKDVVTNAI